jgi:hypothetical protein
MALTLLMFLPSEGDVVEAAPIHPLILITIGAAFAEFHRLNLILYAGKAMRNATMRVVHLLREGLAGLFHTLVVLLDFQAIRV